MMQLSDKSQKPTFVTYLKNNLPVYSGVPHIS